ncbi:MAG: ribosome recycling factor [Bacteroidota bacterium]|nr:ribosome recycling factor [Bacteroidota bacterium]
MDEQVLFYLQLAEEQMEEAKNHLDNIFSKIRAGKANPQMLRTIMVDYYGSQTPLAQTSNITTPDSQTISIQPFDKNLISDIENAITNADLGFTPSNNGERVIINIPPLTEDRRKELVKQAKAESEMSKVTIRNVRQKTNDHIKKLSKEGFSEDIIRDAESSTQKLTDKYIEKINDIFSSKEIEIMKV